MSDHPGLPAHPALARRWPVATDTRCSRMPDGHGVWFNRVPDREDVVAGVEDKAGSQ